MWWWWTLSMLHRSACRQVNCSWVSASLLHMLALTHTPLFLAVHLGVKALVEVKQRAVDVVAGCKGGCVSKGAVQQGLQALAGRQECRATPALAMGSAPIMWKPFE